MTCRKPSFGQFYSATDHSGNSFTSLYKWQADGYDLSWQFGKGYLLQFLELQDPSPNSSNRKPLSVFVWKFSLTQIVGHGLAHWSEHLDDFDGYGAYIWFEEDGWKESVATSISLQSGISVEKHNQSLVELFQKKHGWHSMNDFGTSTYQELC